MIRLSPTDTLDGAKSTPLKPGKSQHVAAATARQIATVLFIGCLIYSGSDPGCQRPCA